jgi:hypothetical protein
MKHDRLSLCKSLGGLAIKQLREVFDYGGGRRGDKGEIRVVCNAWLCLLCSPLLS